MTILLALLITLCLWRLKIPDYHSDFLSPMNTLSIKGFFVFLIFFSHIQGYLSLSDSLLNNIYFSFQNHLGQLIVAMFLFYSGFVFQTEDKLYTRLLQTKNLKNASSFRPYCCSIYHCSTTPAEGVSVS